MSQGAIHSCPQIPGPISFLLVLGGGTVSARCSRMVEAGGRLGLMPWWESRMSL